MLSLLNTIILQFHGKNLLHFTSIYVFKINTTNLYYFSIQQSESPTRYKIDIEKQKYSQEDTYLERETTCVFRNEFIEFHQCQIHILQYHSNIPSSIYLLVLQKKKNMFYITMLHLCLYIKELFQICGRLPRNCCERRPRGHFYSIDLFLYALQIRLLNTRDKRNQSFFDFLVQ